MDGAQGSQFLQDIVSPYLDIDYFLHNTYRVLEMPVTASMKELTRRGTAIETAQQTGAPVPVGNQPIYRIKEELEAEEDNKALLRLGNPDHRMLDIFFWFWPMAHGIGRDEALDYLKSGSEKQAVEVWLQNLHGGGVSGICKHNLAVMYTFKALHHEISASSNKEGGVSAQLSDDWSEAGKYWNLTLEDELTWTTYIEYINLVGDPRVTTGYNRKVRGYLPTIFTALLGNLAVRNISQGSTHDVKRLIEIAQNTGFEEEMVKKGLVLAGKPLEDRARMFLTLTKNNIETNILNAETSIQAFVDGCHPLIDPLTMLYDNSRRAQSLFDTLAETGHDYAMRYAKHTDEWGKTLAFLKTFRNWARSKTTQSTLDEAIHDAGENLAGGNFYYTAQYYTMPAEVLNQANLARKALDQGKAVEAVRSLETLLSDNSANLFISTALKMSLSFSLVRKANMEFAIASESWDAPRPVITKIMGRLEDHKEEITRGCVAAQLGTVQRDYQYLRCAACGDPISYYKSFTTITFKDQKFLICEKCATQDDVVAKSKQNEIKSVLISNHQDLKKALQHNPQNKTAANHLDSVKKIASNIGFSLDGSPVPSTPPARPSQPSYQRPATSQPNKSSSSGCSTTFWVIAGIIFVIYLCSMLNN